MGQDHTAHSHGDHAHTEHSHEAHDHQDHGHSHGIGGHHHHGGDFSRAYAIGAGVNLAFVAAEATAGLLTGSLALLSDAGHNLSDVIDQQS